MLAGTKELEDEVLGCTLSRGTEVGAEKLQAGRTYKYQLHEGDTDDLLQTPLRLSRRGPY